MYSPPTRTHKPLGDPDGFMGHPSEARTANIAPVCATL